MGKLLSKSGTLLGLLDWGTIGGIGLHSGDKDLLFLLETELSLIFSEFRSNDELRSLKTLIGIICL